MRRECDNLLAYIANELNDQDEQAFMKHLESCSECAKEYKELSPAWDALQFDFIEQDVPETLKADVLHFVFEHDSDAEEKPQEPRQAGIFSRLLKQFTPFTASVAGVLFIALAGLGIWSFQHDDRQAASSENIPIEILAAIPLQGTGQGETNGVAYIVKHGSGKNLVLQVHHLPETEGSEVYQVWLLKNQTRENGGIFKPDKNGSGVLTYKLAKGQTFEKIGITLEPDATSTEPRGEKIVGS